jgi:hypothetical protein
MKKTAILLLFLLLLYSRGYTYGVVNYIFNLPTSQTFGSRILMLDVGHRYLDVNKHSTNVNITLGYGITDYIDLNLGYSFNYKDIVASSKINLLDDYSADGDIISFSLLVGGGYKDTNEVNNSLSLSELEEEETKSVTVLEDKERSSFFAQTIFQKHLFKNRVSLGIVPTFAYNTNFYGFTSKDDYSLGSGIFIELYISDRISLNGETIMNLYGFAFEYMNYNAGFKYAGYRHTFSLWVGNCPGYSPVEYVVGNTELTPKLSFAFTREFDL